MQANLDDPPVMKANIDYLTCGLGNFAAAIDSVQEETDAVRFYHLAFCLRWAVRAEFKCILWSQDTEPQQQILRRVVQRRRVGQFCRGRRYVVVASHQLYSSI